MGDAPHGPLVFGTDDDAAAVPNGPIFEVTSDDGSIIVTDPVGPVVDLAAAVPPFASIELVAGMVMVSVPQGVWFQVPFNGFGPVEVLTQDLGAAAGIGIPADEDGVYDCEATLCLQITEIDLAQLGIEVAQTKGGSPLGAGDIPASHVILSNDRATPYRTCATSTVLVDLLAGDHLELWVMGTNPIGSDPFVVAAGVGSLEAVRLKKLFPV